LSSGIKNSECKDKYKYQIFSDLVLSLIYNTLCGASLFKRKVHLKSQKTLDLVIILQHIGQIIGLPLETKLSTFVIV
jgi:uncharacterized membrane protein